MAKLVSVKFYFSTRMWVQNSSKYVGYPSSHYKFRGTILPLPKSKLIWKKSRGYSNTRRRWAAVIICLLAAVPKPSQYPQLLIEHTQLALFPIPDCDNLALSLPNLQQFHTNQTVLLILAYLPALVHWPSTLIFKVVRIDSGLFSHLQLEPLPEVTGIVVESSGEESDLIKQLLLDGYFPDLRHVTLRLEPFIFPWKMGITIPVNDRDPRGPTKDDFNSSSWTRFPGLITFGIRMSGSNWRR